MSGDQQLALARTTTGESSHLSRAARQVVPPFLQKLYEIVNDPRNDELIRWSDNGDSFYVLNHERFAREVLGRWFKHQKFTSFVRQLNMYGFHKIPHLQQGVLRSETDTEPWHFEHRQFQRGQPDLLCLIQRKKQPGHGNADDAHMDMHEPIVHSSAPPLANLTAGQVLDINSVVSGIAAIKRHQQAISADLNELKSSNQHLWQEALAARERHKKHQDTINRILKFLAGVFGNNGDHVHKHDSSSGSPPRVVIPRKRQRLMIGNGDMNGERGKPTTVEEINDNERRRSFEAALGGRPQSSSGSEEHGAIETPESSIPSPSLAPAEAFSPAPSDISTATNNYYSNIQPIPLSATISRGSTVEPSRHYTESSATMSTPTTPINNGSSLPPLTSTAMSQIMTNTQAGAQGQANPDIWSAALQQMLSSPSSFQRLMQALASQQNYPMAPPSDPSVPSAPPSAFSSNNASGIGSLIDHLNNNGINNNPKGTSSQLTSYDPGAYDFSRFRSDLPSSSNTTLRTPSIPPLPTPTSTIPVSIPVDSSTLPLLAHDEEPTLGPLIESADRFQKTYSDASEIDADVDALQYSINSLIENLGLDPNAIMTTGGGGPGPGGQRGHQGDHGVNGSGSAGEAGGEGMNGLNGLNGLNGMHHPSSSASTSMPTQQQQQQPPTTDMNSSMTDNLSHDASSDFDFDAFFNELTTRNPSMVDQTADYAGFGGGGDVPSGSGGNSGVVNATQMNGAMMDDVGTEQLPAFLDEVNVNDHPTAAVPPPLSLDIQSQSRAQGMGIGMARKRKSDVMELPLPQSDLVAPPPMDQQSPKTKRKR